MRFLGKKFLSRFFSLSLIFFVSCVDAGQGGLAAARAREAEAAKARLGKGVLPKKNEPITKKTLSKNELDAAEREKQNKAMLPEKAPAVRRALSKDILDAIEQEKQRIRDRRATKQMPTEIVEPNTVELGKIVPVVMPAEGEEEEEEGDAYTQSEAHLQLDEVKEKMAQFPLYAKGAVLKEGEVRIEKTPNEIVTPYLNIVAAALNKETELKNSHYVFYHNLTNQWRVPQDLHKLLYSYYNPLKPVKDFVFIRFTDMPFIKAQDYLEGHIQDFAGVNDNKDKTILPVNLSLFGSVGAPGECSWNYFIMDKSHKWPFPEQYQQILDSFELSYNIDALVKETGQLSEMLVNAADEQTMLQIFIPKEKVDEIGFLAWIIGFPAHPKSMELVADIVGNRPWVGQVTGPAVKKLMKRYKAEGEDNPYYKELVEAVENGDFGIDAFLKTYCNTPWKLQNPNDTQARLMITSEGLLNPDSGIKFFTYFTTPQDIQESYLKKISELAKKIINQNAKK